jgi:DNA-binding MarR family transcriptional regulator
VHATQAQANALFGCPLWWVKAIIPLVHGKGELLVAIYLWRIRVISHSKTVVLGNSRLLDELGVDRFAKSRTLRRLAQAGLIRLQSKPGQAPRITFLGR